VLEEQMLGSPAGPASAARSGVDAAAWGHRRHGYGLIASPKRATPWFPYTEHVTDPVVVPWS
jgi:hypothetical protein